MTSKPLVFISHAHEEASLADVLQMQLSGMFLGGVRFFVSSDRRSLKGGDEWLRSIREALSSSSVVLTIISAASLERPWINFEAGAAWLQKRVIPVCHSGLKPSQLPQPLQSLVAFDLHDPLDLRDLCALIGETAALQLPNVDWSSLSAELSKAAGSSSHRPRQPFGASACAVFPSGEDLRAIGSLERSLGASSRIAMYSIGLNFMWNASHLTVLERRLRDGVCSARICMANFKSEHILHRLSEEPEHPIGVPGSEHLLRRLVRLESQLQDPLKLAVRTFGHYPTYAMLAFDDELYVYSYGHKTLGNSSPLFYWWGHDPAAKFYHDQFESVWEGSRPAAELYGSV
jgi:hypothetical protein